MSGAHRAGGDRHLRKVCFTQLFLKEVPDWFPGENFSQLLQVLLSKPAMKWYCWVNSPFPLLLYAVPRQSFPSEQARGEQRWKESPAEPTQPARLKQLEFLHKWSSSCLQRLQMPCSSAAYCAEIPAGTQGLRRRRASRAFSHVCWEQPFRWGGVGTKWCLRAPSQTIPWFYDALPSPLCWGLG